MLLWAAFLTRAISKQLNVVGLVARGWGSRLKLGILKTKPLYTQRVSSDGEICWIDSTGDEYLEGG